MTDLIHVCLVCGVVYDPKLGWPSDGIEPGTAWEEVPDNWCCPDCGIAKADFVPMQR
jgi:rubredoxin